MTWTGNRGEVVFACEADGCKQTLKAVGSDLYEAFLYARENGWFAVLNEQFCPRHKGEVG
jgi:hypothetical protein